MAVFTPIPLIATSLSKLQEAVLADMKMLKAR